MQGAMISENLSALSLWGAFLLGLTGGFGHCLAMCGPFVAAASVTDSQAGCSVAGGDRAHRGGVFQVAYHLGRLAMYAALGAVLGLLGNVGALDRVEGPLSPVSVTRFLKLSAGVLMLLIGIVLLVAWARGRSAKLPEPTAALASMPWFGRAIAKLARSGGWWGLPLGALMGLLPCAPLLPVEIAAFATAEPLFGALTMLAFGLGTVPALAGFGAASGLLGARARGWFAPVAAVTVIAMGAITVTQGVALMGAL